MGGFSIWHIVVIAVVAAFLFFGWKQLPDMARSMGRSLRVFKTEIKGLTEDDHARDAEREARAEQAAPKQLAPRPAPAARQAAPAGVVRNAAAPARSSAPAGARPRPAPRPSSRVD